MHLLQCCALPSSGYPSQAHFSLSMDTPIWTDRLSAMTSSLGSLVQRPTTLSVEKDEGGSSTLWAHARERPTSEPGPEHISQRLSIDAAVHREKASKLNLAHTSLGMAVTRHGAWSPGSSWDPLENSQCLGRHRIHLTKQGKSIFANRLANVVEKALNEKQWRREWFLKK